MKLKLNTSSNLKLIYVFFLNTTTVHFKFVESYMYVYSPHSLKDLILYLYDVLQNGTSLVLKEMKKVCFRTNQ